MNRDSGNEIGPFRAVEESTLAHLTPDEVLPDIFAWYSLLGTGGTALGIMTRGWAVHLLQELKGWEFIAACRVVFFIYAALGGLKLLFTLGLSGEVEAVTEWSPEDEEEEQGIDETQPLLGEQSTSAVQAQQHENPPKKNWIHISLDKDLIPLITKLFVLFALDSFASGLASMYVIQPFPLNHTNNVKVLDDILLPQQILSPRRQSRLHLLHNQHHRLHINASRILHRQTYWQRQGNPRLPPQIPIKLTKENRQWSSPTFPPPSSSP